MSPTIDTKSVQPSGKPSTGDPTGSPVADRGRRAASSPRRQRRSRGLSPVLLAAVVGLLGCSASEPPDATTERDELTGPPGRIVSTVPSVTDLIVSLGASERLVGRTDFDTDPALADLPSVGPGLTPNLETVIRLEPDLVILWPDQADRAVAARLEGLGVRVLEAGPDRLDQLWGVVDTLGAILDDRDSARALRRSIQSRLDELSATVGGLDPPSVAFLAWTAPPTVAGAGSYVSDVIHHAGGRNAFADLPAGWPQVSLEELVRRQPDVLLFTRTPNDPPVTEGLADQAGWAALDAVRYGRVVALDVELLGRPGPRVAEAAWALARALHPQVFDAR